MAWTSPKPVDPERRRRFEQELRGEVPPEAVEPGGRDADPQEQRILELKAALRALVDSEPVWVSDWSTRFCAYCKRSDVDDDGEIRRDLGAFAVAHRPDCPWLKARALLEGEG